MAWIVWLIVAAVLGVAELMTTTFALGIIAVGALVAAGVGALDAGLPLQLLAQRNEIKARFQVMHSRL